MNTEKLKDTLRKHGWRPIVSDAQAAQLLRRELKRQRGWKQRNPEHGCDFDYLLAIKRGSWFKLMTLRDNNSYCSILIRRMPPDRSQGRDHES